MAVSVLERRRSSSTSGGRGEKSARRSGKTSTVMEKIAGEKRETTGGTIAETTAEMTAGTTVTTTAEDLMTGTDDEPRARMMQRRYDGGVGVHVYLTQQCVRGYAGVSRDGRRPAEDSLQRTATLQALTTYEL